MLILEYPNGVAEKLREFLLLLLRRRHGRRHGAESEEESLNHPVQQQQPSPHQIELRFDPEAGPLQLPMDNNHNHHNNNNNDELGLLLPYLRALTPQLEHVSVRRMTQSAPHQRFLQLLLDTAPKVTVLDFCNCALTAETGRAIASLVVRQQQQQQQQENDNNNHHDAQEEEPSSSSSSTTARVGGLKWLRIKACPVRDADAFVAPITTAFDTVGPRGSLTFFVFGAQDALQLQVAQRILEAAQTLRTIHWLDLERDWPETLGRPLVLQCLTSIAQSPLDWFVFPAVKHRLFADLLRILVETKSKIQRLHSAYAARDHEGGAVLAQEWIAYLPQLHHLQALGDVRVSRRDENFDSFWTALCRNTSLVEGIAILQPSDTTATTSPQDQPWYDRLRRLQRRNQRIAQLRTLPAHVTPALWPAIVEHAQDYLWRRRPRDGGGGETLMDDDDHAPANPRDPTPVFLFLRSQLPVWFSGGGGAAAAAAGVAGA